MMPSLMTLDLVPPVVIRRESSQMSTSAVMRPLLNAEMLLPKVAMPRIRVAMEPVP